MSWWNIMFGSKDKECEHHWHIVSGSHRKVKSAGERRCFRNDNESPYIFHSSCSWKGPRQDFLILIRQEECCFCNEITHRFFRVPYDKDLEKIPQLDGKILANDSGIFYTYDVDLMDKGT